ncbi:MAG TPA: CAP domain-containing protein [Dehalococcoidia bacterium]|nr:CAP domain-containing protein [Dehalococcoidia bacterium]
MTIKPVLLRVLVVMLVAEAALAAFLVFDRLSDEGEDPLPKPVLTEASQALALQAEGADIAEEGDSPDSGEQEQASGIMVSLINDFRVENGLRPLYVEPALSAAASEYCGVIAPLSWKSHVDPDGRDWNQRAADSGYEGLGIVENLAWGYSTPEEAFAAWQSADADRANLLNALANGVGVAHCSLESGEHKDWWVFMAGIGEMR